MRPIQSALWNIHEPVNNNAGIKLNWAAAASRLWWPICDPQNIAYLPLIWRESSSAAIFLAGWRERTAPSPGCRLPGSSHSHIAWAAKTTTHNMPENEAHAPSDDKLQVGFQWNK